MLVEKGFAFVEVTPCRAVCVCVCAVNCDFFIEELGHAKLLLLCASMYDVCLRSCVPFVHRQQL